MTRSQADALLAENGMEFVEITAEGKLLTVLVVLSLWRARKARSLTPYTVSSAPTWRWALADALDIAPF